MYIYSLQHILSVFFLLQSFIIIPYVSVGPPRSMYKNQVRRARGFLRIMPVKHKAERAGVEGESLRVIKKKKRRKKE